MISISPSEAVSKWRMPAFHNCSTHDGMRIGFHGIENIAGKSVEKLLGGGGEFLRTHQIERLARLQAFDRLLRRWQSAAACRNGRERSSPVIQGLASASLGQADVQSKQKGPPHTAEPFVYSSVTMLLRRRRRADDRPISIGPRAHHAAMPVHHAATAIMRPMPRGDERFASAAVSARHRARPAPDVRPRDRRDAFSACPARGSCVRPGVEHSLRSGVRHAAGCNRRCARLAMSSLTPFQRANSGCSGWVSLRRGFQIGQLADLAGIMVVAHLLHARRHLARRRACACRRARGRDGVILRQHGAGRDQGHHHRLCGRWSARAHWWRPGGGRRAAQRQRGEHGDKGFAHGISVLKCADNSTGSELPATPLNKRRFG